MSGTQTNFISLELLAQRLGLADAKWAKATVRRLIDDGVIESADFRVETSPKISRGRPSVAYFLSPVGALALAMHTRTQEAATWRRAQVEKLAPVPANTLPAASSQHDPAVWAALEQMRRDITALAVRQGEVEQRVEKVEQRAPQQLALPMPIAADTVAQQAAVIAAMEKLITAVDPKGLTSGQVFELIQAGHVAAIELRRAILAFNGGRMPANPVSLGKLLQRVCNGSAGMQGQWKHGHVRRWVITADGVH